jgi:hypothetical protein
MVQVLVLVCLEWHPVLELAELKYKVAAVQAAGRLCHLVRREMVWLLEVVSGAAVLPFPAMQTPKDNCILGTLCLQVV